MKNWGNLSDTKEFLILQGTRGEKCFGRNCSEKKYPPPKKTSVDDCLQQVYNRGKEEKTLFSGWHH